LRCMATMNPLNDPSPLTLSPADVVDTPLVSLVASVDEPLVSLVDSVDVPLLVVSAAATEL